MKIKMMIRLLTVLLAVVICTSGFAGEVNGTVKKLVKGKSKNLKDATLKFTYTKDTTVYKTITDIMGSYTIYLPNEGDYSLELILDTEEGNHDTQKIEPVSIVSFEKPTRYDLELSEQDGELKLDKK